MRRWVKGLIVGVVTGLIGVILVLTPLGADFEKHVGLDWLFKIRGPIEAPREIAVVAIDDRTGGHLGISNLPREWPRSIHARLIENLVKRGASVIVFDMDFRRPRSREDDLVFAKAVAAAERVVLFARLNGKRQPVVDAQGQHQGFVWVERMVPPIAPLAQAAKGIGPFPLPKLQVAVYQFWAFKTSAGGAPTLPSLALQVHALGTYDKWLKVLGQAGAKGMERLPRRSEQVARAGDMRKLVRRLRYAFKIDPGLAEKISAVLDRDGGRDGAERPDRKTRRLIRALAGLYEGGDSRYLNFYGPPGSITTIPYHAVITGKAPRGDPKALDLTGKMVLVGFSDLFDPGQPDRFYTVFTGDDGVDLSGVEIAATALGNLLTDRSLRPSDTTTTVSMVFAFGAIMGGGIYLLPAIFAVPLALVLSGLYVAAVQYGFNAADLWLPLATPVLVQLPLAMFIGLLGQYLLERRQKLRVSEAISHYLPENVARELTTGSLDPNTVNKVVYGTCLATDMAGFTTLSEKLPPKELASYMNAYFDTLAGALKRNNVEITEFHADTIMCAWTGDQSDPAVRNEAVIASLELVDTINGFQFGDQPGGLYARVGMEDGMFYVGHAGGGGRLAYSILGDCANTAARIESLNKQVGTHVLATQTVVDGLNDLLLRPIGCFQLVGKADAVQVVEVLSRAANADHNQIRLCERFEEGLDVFRTQQWDKASGFFEAMLGDFSDDGPARFYLDQCRRYQTGTQPPEDPTVISLDRK